MFKKICWGLFLILIIIILGGFYSNFVNPYSSFTLVKPFFTTSINHNGELTVRKTTDFYFTHTAFDWEIHMANTVFRIFGNALFSEKKFCCSAQEIIAQIHRERFDPNKPYVISGGHFPELYPRNLGLFYSVILDGRITSSNEDWINRQRITLQTVALDLELMKKAGKAYPQFELITPNLFVGEKVYTEQSDSIFAMLWTLEALSKENYLSNIFPASVPSKALRTISEEKILLSEYNSSLKKITLNYLKSIIDQKTGLIKKNITLSSARDGIRRQSSFYDNVIAWSTAKLASDLKIKNYCVQKKQDFQFQIREFEDQHAYARCIDDWKTRIINAFWDEKDGIFLDDLSQQTKENRIFSGDEFIVTSTQFLDYHNLSDRIKLERMIDYVMKNNLDKPLPLRYSLIDQPDRLYWPVRTFARSYMGKTIWSHWGIEYIKTLILISEKHPQYLLDAKKYLEEYKQAIKNFGGYPEVYNLTGKPYQTPFYKSVLHTGWVVNYEEAKMMLNSRIAQLSH